MALDLAKPKKIIQVTRKASRKSDIDKIFFLIRAILIVKKFMHENLKHTVMKHLA